MNATATITRRKPAVARRVPKGAAWAQRVTDIQAGLERAAEDISKMLDQLADKKPVVQYLLEGAMTQAHTVRDILNRRPLGSSDTTAAHGYTAELIIQCKAALGVMVSMGQSPYRAKVGKVIEALDGIRDNLAPESLGKLVPDINTTERDFLHGRDIAVKVLQEAQFRQEQCSDASARLRKYREGAGLENYVEKHLARLANGSPAMRDGFGRVLSCYLADSAQILPSSFDIPYAEFLAGKPGADGTEPADEDADTPEPAPTMFAQGIEKLKHAIYAAREAAEHLPRSNAGWGSVELMERAISHAETASDGDGFDEVSCDLAIARDTTRLIAAGLDSSEFHAIAALISEAKGLVDQHTQELG